MEKPSLIERLAPAANSLIGRRGRIALLMASLTAAPTACSVTTSFSFNTDRDPMDAFRNGALDRGETKVINSEESEAVIALGKIDRSINVLNDKKEYESKAVTRLGGVMHISTHSPLRDGSGPKVFKLAEDDAPWTYLVQESPNVITLRTKCDSLVIKFQCNDLANVDNRNCRGEEVSPNSVPKLCADGHLCETKSYAKQDAGAPDADTTKQDAGAPDGTTDATSDQDAQGDAEVTPGKVIEVNRSNFQQEILDVRDTPTLVVFYTESSQYSQQQMPILDQVAAELGDKFVIAKVNANENRELATQYGVQRIPDSRILMNGSEKEQFDGLQSKETLVSALQKVASENKSSQNDPNVVDGGTTVINASNEGVTETTK